MMALPPLLIMRHGETIWNAERRMQGRLDSPLTERGRRQAGEMGLMLRDLGEDWSKWQARVSSAGRARETAELALRFTGLEPEFDDRLVEVDVGAFQGRLKSDIEDAHPNLFQNPEGLGWHVRVPGGETLQDMETRLVSVLRDLESPTVIVSHGVAIKVLVGVALGLDESEMAGVALFQGSVFRLENGAYGLVDGSIPSQPTELGAV